MAYLLKLKVVDLQIVDAGAGVAISEGDTMMVLKKYIMESENYEEEGFKELANTIVTERVEREKLQKEARTGKLRMEHELEREKLEN